MRRTGDEESQAEEKEERKDGEEGADKEMIKEKRIKGGRNKKSRMNVDTK